MRNTTLFLLLFTLVGQLHAYETVTKQQPNVVVILTDDQGYNDLACYGANDLHTPNIDALAESGIRLTDFYTGATVCTPTRASILTGCYPKRVSLNEGVISPFNTYGLNTEEELLPEVFGANGYTTALIGKWHLGHQKGMLPHNQGFDKYYGVPYSNDMDGHYYAHNDFQSPPLPIYDNDRLVREGMIQDSLTHLWTVKSTEFIEEQSKSKKPFFLYLAHNMPHWAWAASGNFKGKSNRGLYGDAVEEIDWSVGEVMKTLKKSGVLKNTIVIFTSDNGGATYFKGGASNAPLRGAKASTWEGGQRVPCIVSWPKVIKKPFEFNELMTTMDLMPTLMKMCGIEYKPKYEIDGVSMATALVETHKSYERPFYYYARSGGLEAVRKGKWKLHTAKEKQKDFEGPQLFDLSSDIGETTDVSKQNPRVVKELSALMKEFDAELTQEMRPVMGTR